MKRHRAVSASALLCGALLSCANSDHSLGTRDVGDGVSASADRTEDDSATRDEEDTADATNEAMSEHTGATDAADANPNSVQEVNTTDSEDADDSAEDAVPEDTAPEDSEESLIGSYCAMEAECIPGCMTEETFLPCSRPERRRECANTNVEGNEGPECATARRQWFGCMAELSCDDALAFLRAHPDDVEEDTPCAQEFDAASQYCEFEPPTEYDLSGESLPPLLTRNSPVGEPCVPVAELSPGYPGASAEEIDLDTEHGGCESAMCMSYGFQGRVGCPEGNSKQPCLTPDGVAVDTDVEPQLESRPAELAVVCTCRCSGPGDEPLCECPTGTVCVDDVIADLGPNSQNLAGGYCLPEDTTW